MPLNRGYDTQACSLASALEVVGERWTLLIVREMLWGIHRFDEMQRDLGIARNVLQARLTDLVDQGIVAKRPYQERPLRYEYRLTEAGLALWPAIISLVQWGDAHRPSAGGSAAHITHRDCGGTIDAHQRCVSCGADLGPRDVHIEPGAGAGPDHPLRRRTDRAVPAPAS